MAYVPSEENLHGPGGRIVPWFSFSSVSHPIPERLAQEIAQIVVEWGKFEHVITTDTTSLLKYPWVQELERERPRSFKKKIELWKRAVHRAYPHVPAYLEVADEICTNSKIIAHHRNRLIHGAWTTADEEGRGYEVIMCEGREQIERFERIPAGLEYMLALRIQIVALSDALWAFVITRTLHAYLGQRKAIVAPAP